MGWQSQALGSQAADAAAQSWTRPPGRAHGVRVLARGPPSSREEGRDARSVESATVQRGIGVACAASSARPCSLLHIVHTTPCCCRSPSRRVQDGSSNRNGCQALGGRRAPRPRRSPGLPVLGLAGGVFLPTLPARPRAPGTASRSLAGAGWERWSLAAGSRGVDPATVPALPSWPDGYTLVAESVLVELSRAPSPRDPGLALR